MLSVVNFGFGNSYTSCKNVIGGEKIRVPIVRTSNQTQEDTTTLQLLRIQLIYSDHSPFDIIKTKSNQKNNIHVILPVTIS